MGCFPVNSSLPSLGPAPLLSSPVCEMQTSGTVSACMCTTSFCNDDGFRLQESKLELRIPRDAESREPKNFIFPFANSSTAAMPGSRGGRQRRLKCYSCGSLFNRDSPHCAVFDPNSEDQVMTCQEGEACMLYTWKKSRTEIGEWYIRYLCFTLDSIIQDLIESVSLPVFSLAILITPSPLWPPAPCPGPSRTPGRPSEHVFVPKTSATMLKMVRYLMKQ